ncbi:MAG: VWA domain-containing protein [Candidatus Gracilibacteria bacterium]|nr:VWA domain-containing protein [Candidatus Gracilibacteria bacterium]
MFTFENIQTYSILLSSILIVGGVFLSWKYVKQKHNFLILFLLWTMIVLLIIANFSPRYGTYNTEVDGIGGNVTFILDVSSSMNVYDIESPKGRTNRLIASKEIISTFTKKNPENKYGLFAFAGETLQILPYTDDIGLFNTILSGVDQSNISVQGTELEGLFQSVGDFVSQKENNGTVVIFTDGGELSEYNKNIIFNETDLLSEVLIIGVGTEKGGKIIEGQSIFGDYIYKKYNGEVVISQLNNQYLKQVVNHHDFDYYKLDSMKSIQNIFDFINSGITKTNITKQKEFSRDISYLFIVLFMVSFFSYIILEHKIGKK